MHGDVIFTLDVEAGRTPQDHYVLLHIATYPTYCRCVAAFLQQKLAIRKLVL